MYGLSGSSVSTGRVLALHPAPLKPCAPLSLACRSSVLVSTRATLLQQHARAYSCTHLQQHARIFSGPPPCLLPAPRSEAGFQEVRLSPGLQNLLASPILPRGWWNQQLLLALKQVRLGCACFLLV